MNDTPLPEIKYVCISRVNDQSILLQVGSDTAKKAYLDEVNNIIAL